MKNIMVIEPGTVTLREIEKELTLKTLRVTDTKGEAARRLGITRKGLYDKLRRWPEGRALVKRPVA